MIWIWEPSRACRDLEEWAGFLKFLKKHKICQYIESHRTLYDVANSRRERKSLADDGIDSQWEAEKNSARVIRDVADAAEKGRAHGRLSYGFRRTYAWQTGSTGRRRYAMTGQFPNKAEAGIVKEIIESVARGDSLRTICARFDERGVTTARLSENGEVVRAGTGRGGGAAGETAVANAARRDPSPAARPR